MYNSLLNSNKPFYEIIKKQFSNQGLINRAFSVLFKWKANWSILLSSASDKYLIHLQLNTSWDSYFGIEASSA